MSAWTHKEVETLIEMRGRGCSYTEIAKVVNKVSSQCSNKMWHIEQARQRKAETAETAAKIQNLFNNGMMDKEICAELGLKQYELSSIKKLHGIRRTSAQISAINKKRAGYRKKDRIHYSGGIKDSICWTCKNALVRCQKPVDGFVAKVVKYGDYDPPKWSYLVVDCPNYDPEPYANQRGGNQ